MDSTAVWKSWELAHLMCQAAGEHLYTTVMISGLHGENPVVKKNWAGGEPSRSSRAPQIGPAKLDELLHGDLTRPFELSPVAGYEKSTGYLGGVRLRHPEEDIQLWVSGSAWAERCDALFALTTMYSLLHEVHLHHVGFGHESEDQMMEAVRQDEARLGSMAVHAPAPDHDRYYLHVDAPYAPFLGYLREHQFGMGSNLHWDLWTPNPLELLEFVAELLPGSTLDTWDAGPNDPVGVIWEVNRDGRRYGIMARNNTWRPAA